MATPEALAKRAKRAQEELAEKMGEISSSLPQILTHLSALAVKVDKLGLEIAEIKADVQKLQTAAKRKTGGE